MARLPLDALVSKNLPFGEDANNFYVFSNASVELKLLTDLLSFMTDEGTRAMTGVQEEKAWFVKKRLEFTLPEEIA